MEIKKGRKTAAFYITVNSNYLIEHLLVEVIPNTVVLLLPASQASVAFFFVSLITVVLVTELPAVETVHSHV